MDLIAQEFIDTTEVVTLLDRLATVGYMIICNGTSSAVTWSLYHPITDSESFGQANALFYDVTLAANSSEVLELTIPLSEDFTRFAIQCSDADALTVSVYGEVGNARFSRPAHC